MWTRIRRAAPYQLELAVDWVPGGRGVFAVDGLGVWCEGDGPGRLELGGGHEGCP